MKAITALREALAEQAEPKCNPHPDAPHGFDRNASHSANRYVCECEGWEPEQAEQGPVAWMYVNYEGECEQIEYGEPFNDPSVTPLYAAPVRTKDLTDDEIEKAFWGNGDTEIEGCRAVIAADREKNRG